MAILTYLISLDETSYPFGEGDINMEKGDHRLGLFLLAFVGALSIGKLFHVAGSMEPVGADSLTQSQSPQFGPCSPFPTQSLA